MKPILFTIKGVNFYSYGFFVSMAFLATYFVFYYLSYKNEILKDKLLFEKLVVILLAGLIGARALFVILYPEYFSNWVDYFKIWEGGLVSFGGIVAGFISFILIFRKKIWLWLDISTVAFLAGAGTWRIGCFLTGDHPCVFSTAWYAINYEVPAILFELIVSYVGFIIGLILYKKHKFKNGYLFFLLLMWYGLTRIIVDNYRDDPIYYGLKGGQIAGIIIVIITIIGVLLLKYFKYKKQNLIIKK